MNSKSDSLVNRRLLIAAVCTVTFAGGLFSSRAKADQWDKKTILTIDQPVQVQDTLLEPGQYVFKLHDSSAERHVVQIFNADQSQIIDTVIAIPNYRLQPTGNSRFAFWETPPGSARAMRAWFYPGDNFGQEFRYPKQLAMLTATSTAPATTSAPAPEPSTPLAAPQPETSAQPEPQTQPQAMMQEPQQEQPPADAAQSTPPPPANEGATSQELPKTASLYPLIGLSGLLSLGVYGLVRLKRPA